MVGCCWSANRIASSIVRTCPGPGSAGGAGPAGGDGAVGAGAGAGACAATGPAARAASSTPRSNDAGRSDMGASSPLVDGGTRGPGGSAHPGILGMEGPGETLLQDRVDGGDQEEREAGGNDEAADDRAGERGVGLAPDQQ